MNTTNMHLDEDAMTYMIKDFLCLGNGSKFIYQTISGKTEINFSGSRNKVQKEIYNWLNTPERKQAFSSED